MVLVVSRGSLGLIWHKSPRPPFDTEDAKKTPGGPYVRGNSFIAQGEALGSVPQQPLMLVIYSLYRSSYLISMSALFQTCCLED